MERVVGLTGQDVGFAAPVAFIGEQVPGALGLNSLLRRQESQKSIQVRLGCPGLVSKVAFTKWTADGEHEAPSWRGLRLDKDSGPMHCEG